MDGSSDCSADGCARVHRTLDALPKFSSPSEARHRLGFSDGLYAFHEEGEVSPHGSPGRIVRVGNHPLSDGTLWRRLGEHYTGRKKGSVFRRYLGGALLRRDDPASPCLAPSPGKGHWEQQNGQPCPDCQPTEQRVSTLLRERFWFRCVPVPDRAERNALEHRLVATLAACPTCRPSDGWLGHHAYSQTVRAAGLWNSQGVGSPQMDPADLERLAALAAEGGAS